MAREGLGLQGLVETPTPGPLPAVQTLHCIREELSQIKAQVDHLLESLEHADQLPGQAPHTLGGVQLCSLLKVRGAPEPCLGLSLLAGLPPPPPPPVPRAVPVA